MTEGINILTTKDAAVYAGYSSATVVRACDAGKIKHFRTPGGHRRIYLSDLVDFMAAKKGDPDDFFA